ncbi:ATP-binding cassette domain-containing protein [Paenibacillus sp. P25]|nr:ATP-binding cassette domain-containing protein [Paenibacillus sp. P25]
MCGFYPLPEDQGTIEVFGQPIRSGGLSELRSHFAVVTQDAYLFSGTIAENIAYGREHATMDEVMEAAQRAHAHSFIMEFPEGYQTEVGERGGRLSGGQRQRITIARAFLKNAPILLLDEPTSALDTASEFYVQEALNVLMKDRTTMVVAHRLSTIEKADEIWVMEQGEIAEAGSHAESLERNGLYARLYHQEFTAGAAGSKEVICT